MPLRGHTVQKTELCAICADGRLFSPAGLKQHQVAHTRDIVGYRAEHEALLQKQQDASQAHAASEQAQSELREELRMVADLHGELMRLTAGGTGVRVASLRSMVRSIG